jgi:two-component system, cell cycle response regulator
MTEPPKATILVADDDSSMRRFIEVMLQQANYDVLTAEDGLEAMRIALENHIDAVVADAIMPNMSGYDLCRMLKGDPQKAGVPMVILSGLDPVNSDKPADHLADAFLTKGTNLKSDLLSSLQTLLHPAEAA